MGERGRGENIVREIDKERERGMGERDRRKDEERDRREE